ncbi:hypothetical protein ALC57_16320 [Trachymyrmex cornetzi]|uniref:Uncharacterized protein n=1 Tax=Trachymyrmex cornetzi TaxID=471704 RepID=A0A195DF98_9HYME|nr:hypothetical protein ALC57_16320 [Trachymyrmex cornetzi]
MFDLRRYGYLVASLINRECIEISETASSDVVCAPRATCRDETASVNSRELQGFRQAEGSGRMESGPSRRTNSYLSMVVQSNLARIFRNGEEWRVENADIVFEIVHSVLRMKAHADRAERTFVTPAISETGRWLLALACSENIRK